jgi:hypothetical protein
LLDGFSTCEKARVRGRWRGVGSEDLSATPKTSCKKRSTGLLGVGSC